MEQDKGFTDMPVRFFIPVEDETGWEIQEVIEAEFLVAEGNIEYERHTVRENGCKQICLTKMPKG